LKYYVLRFTLCCKLATSTLGCIQLPVQFVRRDKAAGEWSCLPHTSSAEGQNERSCTSSSSYAILACI